MTLQSGDIVDRYRLTERLGAGAFGEVWKASQLADGNDIGVTCAVKVTKVAPDSSGSSPRPLANGWLDEVRNLVRVAGDTIPRIYDADIWNEHAYIAMELLNGQTLGARLATGPIAWRRALYIADEIARALEAGHQVGLVHRDLKPQNVMLVGPHRVCVVDWGIARLQTPAATQPPIAAPQGADADSTDARPVMPILLPRPQAAALGTPGYMAPEVYEGAAPAPLQDVFALGVVLYEMIAGCLPHAVEPLNRFRTSPDSVRTYRSALDRATMDHRLIPLRARRPDLPSGLVQLVDALLARRPEDRPAHVREAIALASRFPQGVPDPPYAGLGSLGREHAGLYFGQQDAIQHVLARLASHRGVLLWGPSGSGKSSLALAGVAATMDRTLFLDTDGWDVHVVRPREGRGRRVATVAPPPGPARIGQVVIIDQLEEVVDLEPHDRDAFCHAVLALLQRTAPVRVQDAVIGVADEVRVIATVRDDLEWRIDREVPLLQPLLEHRVIAKGVDANFARSIIEEPARALGYQVEGIEAVSREVEACLSFEPSKLPIVQYALSEWWQRRDDGRKLLPAAAWRELGGVDGALSSVAERLWSTLHLAQRLCLKALFVQLFQDGRKQPLPESMLTPEARRVMRKLVRLRLVGRREKQGSAPFYEVEHEAFAEHWTRLAGWLAEAREDRALTEELERDAEAYLRDHDPERLWKRGRIAAARDMARRGRIVLSPNATQFLRHARRRELRNRFVLGGVALILSVVWLLAVNAVTSQERRNMERDLDEARQEAERARREVQDTVERKQLEMATRLRGVQDDTSQRIKAANAEALRTKVELGTVKAQLGVARDEVRSAREDARAAREAERKAREQASFWYCVNVTGPRDGCKRPP